MLLFVVAGVVLAFWLLASYKGFGRKWLAAAITLIFCTPYFLWEVFWPRPADITAYSDTVDYEFRDPDYAAEFAELNKDHLISMS